MKTEGQYFAAGDFPRSKGVLPSAKTLWQQAMTSFSPGIVARRKLIVFLSVYVCVVLWLITLRISPQAGG
jgi:hypothetical protein